MDHDLRLFESDFSPTDVQNATRCMDKYKIKAELVDPWLEYLVQQAMLAFRSAESQEMSLVLSQFMYTVIKVCGTKAVLPLMPHDLRDLSSALSRLDSAPAAQWSLVYILILWITAIIRSPFPLKKDVTDSLEHRALQLMSTHEGRIQDASVMLLVALYSRTGSSLSHFKESPDPRVTAYLLKWHLPRLSSEPGLISSLCANYSSHPPVTLAEAKVLGRLALSGVKKYTPVDPSFVSWALSQLVASLVSPDTSMKMRYSAAKYVARIACSASEKTCVFLRSSLYDTISLHSDFLSLESESAWEGIGLCLSEMLRLSERPWDLLDDHFFSYVKCALAFDFQRGKASVGSSVRDTAAFVCWCAARYTPGSRACDKSSQIVDISHALLLQGVFDSQVHVRRACGSAYQEMIGQWNSCIAFPHGIELVSLVSAHLVTSPRVSFLSVAVEIVSMYPVYENTFLSRALTLCEKHYDPVLRERAAYSAALMCVARSCVDRIISEHLQNSCLLAYLAPWASSDSRHQIMSLPNESQWGIIAWGAALGVPSAQARQNPSPGLVSLREDWLECDTFFASLVPLEKFVVGNIWPKLEKLWSYTSEGVSFCLKMLQRNMSLVVEVIRCLEQSPQFAKALAFTPLSELPVEVREEAARRLGHIVIHKLGTVEDRAYALASLQDLTQEETLSIVLQACAAGLRDFTRDQRGDVGFQVRCKSCDTLFAALIRNERARDTLVAQWLPHLLRQAVSRRVEIRERAGRVLSVLNSNCRNTNWADVHEALSSTAPNIVDPANAVYLYGVFAIAVLERDPRTQGPTDAVATLVGTDQGVMDTFVSVLEKRRLAPALLSGGFALASRARVLSRGHVSFMHLIGLVSQRIEDYMRDDQVLERVCAFVAESLWAMKSDSPEKPKVWHVVQYVLESDYGHVLAERIVCAAEFVFDAGDEWDRVQEIFMDVDWASASARKDAARLLVSELE